MSKDHTILCNCSLPLLQYIVLNQIITARNKLEKLHTDQNTSYNYVTYYLTTAPVNILNLKCNHKKKSNRKNATKREMFQN